MLNELQRDLLTELVNVYVGQAASMLSEMVQQKIDLAIPKVELVSTTEVNPEDHRFNIFMSEGHLITSSLKFGHEFRGKAILMFPIDQAKILVNTCLGEITSDLDTDAKSLMDTDLDVLKEISNVILNAIIGEFGNFLGLRLEYALPDIELVSIAKGDKTTFLQNEVHVLILQTSFSLAETNIKGAIVIALSMDSISSLLKKIDELLEEIHG
ncbi:chemotaxis protein CheC [Schinkia azotoformans]|uniref:MCP methylation inhibitor CheC n=1 Tax=Schinkia azotoformans LMG 9581 TaxID=1131731 RepID=K6DI49_SCHAZ|nr:chemotaxis protein CheC [Schinkia azotoformans]EKN67793.1 MCP methylation inhibitor CheC [Schinkia azotoformans LMG 9581]MEC1637443.1 chemotaxis protein CheC [Schinkia azotoformans]MEC1719030.1 chemotaxis protein CheC [Schinkia azotoformans]MEC1943847.1 chemotaxis protein CheC [Schinkia azotoformans]MED4352252.1 chemotaxis protein CheC [Schinkia azotoformans]